ncbi:alpha-E domain-containing protein [Tengunoibacter tsumagoiensis]|uniref:DUF403 domain-containing protein n=1 Tax=Tengunoibacter tsumagoiensis TaxID=2014871 RepID=A0A402A6D6_9CHLR|nr:alpha-E domain-containing protein [Tengunoibacter tsumagoiensis]GCE14692.1 hypothetical protein KTT_45510 [Tengunoibacter tsumagoiensis]
MLSRVADNLYWMSRYLERAEHTARLLDESLHQMLDQDAEHAEQRWERLRLSLHLPPLGENPDEVFDLTRSLTFDANNSASLLSCIAQGRENGRQVREQISTEMWEQVNRLYLQIKRIDIDEVWYADPYSFLKSIKEGVQLFQGITDATMNHSEGWHFIRVGRFIERAQATASLLDVHFSTYLKYQQEGLTSPLDYLDYMGWVGLLRSCTSFEAYCKVYTATIDPEKIAEFLLLNAESPRSVRFAATMIQSALQAIARSAETRSTKGVERLAGRLRSSLEYDQVEDIFHDMHSYLENIQRQCTQIHKAIYQAYIVYPIDVALTGRGAAQE